MIYLRTVSIDKRTSGPVCLYMIEKDSDSAFVYDGDPLPKIVAYYIDARFLTYATARRLIA